MIKAMPKDTLSHGSFGWLFVRSCIHPSLVCFFFPVCVYVFHCDRGQRILVGTSVIVRDIDANVTEQLVAIIIVIVIPIIEIIENSSSSDDDDGSEGDGIIIIIILMIMSHALQFVHIIGVMLWLRLWLLPSLPLHNLRHTHAKPLTAARNPLVCLVR